MGATSKRPFPRERERASKEAASENCVFLRHPEAPRQLHSARMLIGARWIGLMTETVEFNADNIRIRQQTDAWRTRDVDEAVCIWGATAATTPVEIFITPEGRVRGRGIELAVALVQRGVPVNYGPVYAL